MTPAAGWPDVPHVAAAQAHAGVHGRDGGAARDRGDRAQPARGHEPRLDDRQRAGGARRRRRRGRRHRASWPAPASRSRRCWRPTAAWSTRRPAPAPGRCSSPAELARARTGRRDRRAHAPRGRRAAAAGPAGERRGGRAVLVVGESLAQRERALDALHALLAIGGPLALLIASAVGYALAAAALRPVERMRRHAAAITAAADERAAAGAAGRRRDRAARPHAERDAGPARGRVQARARVRLRRLARAAHAAGDPAHRARAGAARRAHARGARGGAALGRRGVRAALAGWPRTCS